MPNNQTIVSLDDVQLPYSLEAEQAVLGCVLTEPDCITQVLILLKSEHFYLPQHQAIFNIMQKIDALGESELSDAELAYYMEVTSRVSQKLLRAAG